MRFAAALYSIFSRPVCRFKRWLYGRGLRQSRSAPLIVLSVGNIAHGGSEKTPLVLEILRLLLRHGYRPALVSRGYKGTWEKRGGIVSDGGSILAGWREAGDEPLMAALEAPGAGVFVGRERWASCRKAADMGFDVAVLDDGFQHLRLRRDLDIVLHDPAARTGLREGPSALRRAGIVLLKKSSAAGSGNSRPFRTSSSTFLYGVSAAGVSPLDGGPLLPIDSLRGRKLAAFCGIARPERFFGLVDNLGLDISARAVFPDHFFYPDKALNKLAAAALNSGCGSFLTTEKDAVKLRGRMKGPAGLPVFVLRIGLDLPEEFSAAVLEALARIRGGRS